MAEEAPGSEAKVIRIGTRKSPLALAQAQIAVDALQAALPTYTFPIDGTATTGDQDQRTALYSFGGKGLWTSQLEERLAAGTVDAVVHSLKDMPTELPAGMALACIMRREDPRDALVLRRGTNAHVATLADLPAGAVVGTSSVRRIAQLARGYPHLCFRDVRGNIHTRLRKLDDGDDDDGDDDDKSGPPFSAIILAAAGLKRMGLEHRIVQLLDADGAGVLHAVGQGALGIECRAGDERVVAAFAPLVHRRTTLACLAERSLMRALEGGCSVPIGVETSWPDGNDDDDDSRGGRLRLRATVVSVAGDKAVDADIMEEIASEQEAEAFGHRVAQDLVARGADDILRVINADKAAQVERARAQAAQEAGAVA